MWAGTEPDELKAAWASELAGYEGDDIRLALEALRFGFAEWPPSLFQFADLCRDARLRRRQTARVLDSVRGKVEIEARVLAEINRLARGWRESKRDPRDWARKILQREQQGEKLPVIALRLARDALGLIEQPEPEA